MIITRSPLRISLGGGGTDLPSYYREHSGFLIAAAIDKYLTLLKSGGSDHPMALLKRAGVDLSKPETVRAVVDQLDTLVTRLEREISAM